MRGLFFAAASAKVHRGEAEWIGVLSIDCNGSITDRLTK
jgi:hypothetical protein